MLTPMTVRDLAPSETKSALPRAARHKAVSAKAAQKVSEVQDTAIVEALISVMERMKGHFMSAVGSVGLTPPQAHLLRLLNEPRPMHELAENIGCDASNITSLVDKLEEQSLVERQADPKDRRVKRIAITTEGRERSQEIMAALISDAPEFTGLTSAEKTMLVSLLGRVTAI
jgi:DNA-binding MarR family transcriptional regulator